MSASLTNMPQRLLAGFLLLLGLWSPTFAQLVVPPLTAECATSVDGSVVLVPNPLHPPVATELLASSTLPIGLYFIKFVWYDALNHVTLASPEVQVQLGHFFAPFNAVISVAPPTSGMPATAAGMQVFIGTTSGGETLQGSTTGSAPYVQRVPLVSGAALPTANTTVCQVIANDAGWPSGTGYVATLTTPAGATMPGYPMQWQLLGPGGTINLGNGLPLYNGTVTYPIPILARPQGHGPQSISGSLSLGTYNLNAGAIGLGTSVPGWAVDAEGSGAAGAVNAKSGYLFNGFAPLGHVLIGNGSYYVDSMPNFPGLIIANEVSTGTILNTLAKLTGNPSSAIIAQTGDIQGIVGVVTGGAGTSGMAAIQQTGTALCIFDGPTTAGNFVVNSTTVAGDCHAQSFYPQGSEFIGYVLSTNSSDGTYLINLSLGPAFPAGGQASISAGSGAGTGGTVNCVTPGSLTVTPCLNGGGLLSVATGTSPSASQAIAILYFASINSYAQSCSFFPATGTANLATIEPQLTINIQNGYVQLVGGSTALTASTTYLWNYQCSFSAQ